MSLFCFYCLLFGGDTLWTKNGCKDLKHLSERIQKHECSSTHMNNAVKYKTLGTVNIMCQLSEGYSLSIKRHNELVEKNRHILNRIIDCIKFCGVHELALRGHDETDQSHNRGVFLDLISHTARFDSILDEHLNCATVSKNTSKTIQNDLLDAIYQVYLEELETEIKSVNFVSVQADETTDVSCRSQFVIILRFLKGCVPVERFLSFIDVKDKTALGLSSVLLTELTKFNLKNKLISQAYDGAAVMSGIRGGVQVLMKEHFPLAHYVHCYAHQINIVLKNVCSIIKGVRIFFANVSGISFFFSSSPKRSNVLREICTSRIPTASQTRWNYHSKIINSIKENSEELLECFQRIQNEDHWDDKSIREAAGFERLLKSEEFILLTSFFYKVFKHVDTLFSITQARSTTGPSIIHALHSFETAIAEIRNDTHSFLFNLHKSCNILASRRPRLEQDISIEVEMKEVCDIITNQIKERCEKSEIFRLFCLVDPKEFKNFKHNFPDIHICRSIDKQLSHA